MMNFPILGAALAAIILLAGPLRADVNLSAALEAVRAQNYDAARSAQARVADPVARDVVTWSLLRARQGSFDDATAFLSRNADWPGLPLLRARMEGSIPDTARPRDVVQFFAPQQPQTPQGVLRYAEALQAMGEPTFARAALVRAWRTMPMSLESHAGFLEAHGALLAPHHSARLDTMVWDGHDASAAAMYPLVSAGEVALARARLALRAEDNGVDTLIEAVPAALQDDAGLAYERFRWRLSKGRTDGALEILFDRSRDAARLGRPDVWAQHRESLARRLMREDRNTEAYRVAAFHFVDDVSEEASTEWLAGYIALRKLGQADRAIDHFEQFRRVVGTPISFGRAGYWLGRAHEDAGNAEAARAAYAFGARYQTSFYGQLAAERGGIAPDPLLAGTETFPDYRSAAFMDASVLRAALVLRQAGDAWLTERFLTHLAESLTRQEIGQLIDMVIDLGEPHIAVMIGKRAATMGLELHKGYYALMPELATLDTPVPNELVLSIGRRESEFDPGVISPAGARGLLQLMPGTAQEMAGRTGETYSAGRLLSDPLYNARLGAAYLDLLEDEFGDAVILVAAAYNAGPTRARRWSADLGHPADPGVDPVDWIEHVPFTETRNYIMRVTESLAIYRARLTGQVQPLGLTAALRAR